jgi:hypothetical protein
MARLPEHIRQYPPWVGPEGPLVDTKLPRASGNAADYPFDSSKGTDQGMFPPVCLRSHWDPEQIIRRTLPAHQLSVPLEPRPWTKVCLEYTTTQDFQEAPRPHDDLVMPTGGTNYPPSRYKEAIDNESLLKRLDRPLGTPEENEYKVNLSGNLFRPNSTVPNRQTPNSRFIDELSFPMACIRNSEYDCRQEAHREAFARSPLPFNNATKQNRYRPQGSKGSSATYVSQVRR